MELVGNINNGVSAAVFPKQVDEPCRVIIEFNMPGINSHLHRVGPDIAALRAELVAIIEAIDTVYIPEQSGDANDTPAETPEP